MAIVIKFPSKDIRITNILTKKLDKIQFKSEDMKNCVKKSVASAYQKYSKLPDYQFSIDLPPGISETLPENFSKQISKELIDYAQRALKPLLDEICLLHVEICKLKLKIDK